MTYPAPLPFRIKIPGEESMDLTTVREVSTKVEGLLHLEGDRLLLEWAVTRISEEVGLSLEKADLKDLGRAKKIVIGKDGATIKRISSEARREIGEINDAPVHLFLFVKVRENWGSDPERYREMGLKVPKG